MDIRNGKNYDLIDSKIEDEFYKNEGINKKKLSLIHLDIRKLRKYNILSNFKKEESIISLNKNYDIKKNKKLNHQLSLSKMSFTKNKNKLTPFQKILKKSYQERKIVEQMKKNNSPIKELVVTNTIPIEPEKRIDKIKIVSIAPLFAEAIKRLNEVKPLGDLFEYDK